MRDYLLLYINGKRHKIAAEQAFMPLSSFVRNELAASGTKVVCEEGDCGACSVLFGRVQNGEMTYRPVNSCIQFLYQLDCSHIVTIEGLKDDGQLNAVQNAMVECHGAQCGYCTPGFVVTMCSMFDRRPPVSEQDVKDGLTGNLCRCTGYEPIIKAALAVNPDKITKLAKLYPSEEMMADFSQHQNLSLSLQSAEHRLFVPSSLSEAVKFKQENPSAVVVSGGTDVCVYWNKRGSEPPVLLSLANVDEMLGLAADPQSMTVGARVTLAELEDFVRTRIPSLANILWLFGSPQIRNAATLAGNIANASPIADSIPFLFVMDAQVELVGPKGARFVNMNQLYTGYKQMDMSPDELIVRVHIPVPQSDETVKLYKVSKRKHLDISAFTAAVRIKREGRMIKKAAIAYGGVAATVVRLPKTEAFLQGKPFDLETLTQAGETARSEITPISDVRGSSDFRLVLAANILQKLYFDVEQQGTPACQQ